jgi:hypothetical protein
LDAGVPGGGARIEQRADLVRVDHVRAQRSEQLAKPSDEERVSAGRLVETDHRRAGVSGAGGQQAGTLDTNDTGRLAGCSPGPDQIDDEPLEASHVERQNNVRDVQGG